MGLVSAGPGPQSITAGHSLGGDEQFPQVLRASSIPQDLHMGRAAVRGGCPTAERSGQAGPGTVPKSRHPGRHQQIDSLPPPAIYLHPGHQGFPLAATAGCGAHRAAVYTHTAPRGPCLPAASSDRSPWPSKQDITPPGGTTKSPSTELHAHKPMDALMADSCCHPRSKGDRQAVPPNTTPAACHRASATGAAAATSQPLSPNAAGARWQCSVANWPGREPGGTRGPGTTTSRLLAPAGEMVRSWWPRSPAPGLGKAACHHGQLCLSRLCRTHHGAGR